MNIPNSLRKLVAACAVSAAAHAGAVPILLVNSDGILTGANGVDVAGILYNVTFAEGSCDSLFNGCDTSTFAFSTLESAEMASQALLDQVFLDGPEGQFDSDPSRTFGCTSLFVCDAITPYQRLGLVQIGFAENGSVETSDVAGTASVPTDLDTSDIAFVTYALFQQTDPVTEVPEPGSLALISLALAGLAFARRKM